MIDLTKRAQSAVVSLTKVLKEHPSLGELTGQIHLVVDFSGSMTSNYNNGMVQRLVERALGLAMSGLDDDGQVPVHFFHSQVFPVVVADAGNAENFVQRWQNTPTDVPYTEFQEVKVGGLFGKKTVQEVTKTRRELPRMGGTNYLPAISQVLETTDLSPDQPPTLVLFVTDGQSMWPDKVRTDLRAAADRPVFWQFMGLGWDQGFMEDLNKRLGGVVDNVGAANMEGSDSWDDVKFYDTIVSEFFTEWLPAARAQGITRK